MRKILIALILLASLPAQAEIYKWVDENGKTHFSDIKPAGQASREIRLRPMPPASRGPGGATETPVNTRHVTLYATSWCGYCAKARQHFRANNIPYTEHDIEKSESARRMYDQLGGNGVPVILVGDRRMNGFSVSGFNAIYQSP